jgi:hypothetical protein
LVSRFENVFPLPKKGPSALTLSSPSRDDRASPETKATRDIFESSSYHDRNSTHAFSSACASAAAAAAAATTVELEHGLEHGGGQGSKAEALVVPSAL